MTKIRKLWIPCYEGAERKRRKIFCIINPHKRNKEKAFIIKPKTHYFDFIVVSVILILLGILSRPSRI